MKSDLQTPPALLMVTVLGTFFGIGELRSITMGCLSTAIVGFRYDRIVEWRLEYRQGVLRDFFICRHPAVCYDDN
jgi:hypothetical protein